jgi:hypothetical protein
MVLAACEAAGDLGRDPRGAVLVQPLPVNGQEFWPASAFRYGQIGRPRTEPLSAGSR